MRMLSCILAAFIASCSLFPAPSPNGQLTPAQQQAIDVATQIRGDADLANGILQTVATVDPSLAPEAIIAAAADKEIDTLAAQYIQDVTTGASTGTLLTQLETDLAQILQIVSGNASASQQYIAAKAEVTRASTQPTTRAALAPAVEYDSAVALLGSRGLSNRHELCRFC